MNKHTALLSVLLSAAACGSVQDNNSTTGGLADDGIPDETPDSPDMPDMPDMPAGPALTLAEPIAATTPASLFAVDFGSAEIAEVVTAHTSAPRYDIVQQQLITTQPTATPIVVELAPPTGSFHRSIVAEAFPTGSVDVAIECVDDSGTDLNDPRCGAAPQTRPPTTAYGALTRGRWGSRIVDATGTTVPGCTGDATRLACTLPAAPVGTTYSIILSADGFADLWPSTSAVSLVTALAPNLFTGNLGSVFEHCARRRIAGKREYCLQATAYTQFSAIDSATLDFDPISLVVIAGTTSSTHASPALSWDPGNDDLPGAAY